MTKDDDGMGRDGGERLGTAELRRVLTGELGYAIPADLVITTRAEIESREFTAYGQGWRDRAEHEEHHAGDTRAGRTGRDQEAKVLPFPRQRQSAPASFGQPVHPAHPVPPRDEPS
ncbi:hypothetical protein [Streptomyces sp. NPDC050535]|uniref:hypothetical protein n=1 Tax=Streptomyces sp. NPDC050535 TaxID=3365626 RepID=UPI00378BD399